MTLDALHKCMEALAPTNLKDIAKLRENKMEEGEEEQLQKGFSTKKGIQSMILIQSEGKSKEQSKE